MRSGSYIETYKKIRQMGYSERYRQAVECRREENRRMGLTPKDNFGKDFVSYIEYLDSFTDIEEHFDDLDDKTSYMFRHANGRGYLEWMFEARNVYQDLKAKGTFKFRSDDTREQEARAAWSSYYDNNPQFSRPAGY
jgi:hypothetical protein